MPYSSLAFPTAASTSLPAAPPASPPPPLPAHHSPPTSPRPPFPAHLSRPSSPSPPLPAHLPPCASCTGAHGAASAHHHAAGVGPRPYEHRGCAVTAGAKGPPRLSGGGGAQVGASRHRRRRRSDSPKALQGAQYLLFVYSTDGEVQHAHVGTKDDAHWCFSGARHPAAPHLAPPLQPSGSNRAHGGHGAGPLAPEESPPQQWPPRPGGCGAAPPGRQSRRGARVGGSAAAAAPPGFHCGAN